MVDKDINIDALNGFIGVTDENEPKKKLVQEKDRSIVEVMDKKIITEDGRTLLIN